MLIAVLFIVPHGWTTRGGLYVAKLIALLLSATWLFVLSASLALGVMNGKKDPLALMFFCAPALLVAYFALLTLYVRARGARSLTTR